MAFHISKPREQLPIPSQFGSVSTKSNLPLVMDSFGRHEAKRLEPILKPRRTTGKTHNMEYMGGSIELDGSHVRPIKFALASCDDKELAPAIRFLVKLSDAIIEHPGELLYIESLKIQQLGVITEPMVTDLNEGCLSVNCIGGVLLKIKNGGWMHLNKIELASLTGNNTINAARYGAWKIVIGDDAAREHLVELKDQIPTQPSLISKILSAKHSTVS